MKTTPELENYAQGLWRIWTEKFSLQERDYLLKSLQSKHGGFA